jgi:hypothetical protein
MGIVQAAGEVVREHDGQRHKCGSLRSCVPDHGPLVTRPLLHRSGTVSGLQPDTAQYLCGGIVANVGVHAPDDSRDVDLGQAGHLARNVDATAVDESFDGYSGELILREMSIQDGIRDLISDLIDVPSGN